MDYKVEYGYSKFGKVEFIENIKLHFDKILITICLNRKYHCLNIYIRRQENCKDKRKKIDVSIALKGINDYLKSNQLLCERESQIFKQDILKIENVRDINIYDLELCEIDSLVLCSFPKLSCMTTNNCTIYENFNLGRLKCNYYVDHSSSIRSLDIFNGFAGQTLELYDSKIINQNQNVLHLNNICTCFDNLQNMDYEYFFLTTNAPKMRKLEIYNKERLKSKDLLFISGFYNLESIEIDGNIENYVQIEKLEKLCQIRGLFCIDERELEATKEKRKEIYEKIEGRKRQQNYLMMQRMIIQNNYQKFFHKIYVPRLERVSWQDKISSYELEQIKKELQEIAKMSRKERKQLAREPKKEYNLFDSINGLWFDKIPNQDEDDECYLVNSSPDPFMNDGMDYYVLKRKIYIEE